LSVKLGVKKYCNFCGEPMQAEAKECKQCGWDVSQNGPPTTDPGDTKARIGVAAGLVIAYSIMWVLIQGTPVPARAAAQKAPRYVAAPEVIEEPVGEAVSQPAMAIGALPPTVAASVATSGKPTALINIRVADTRTTIPPHEALQYAFQLPETDQKCKLVGSTKGVGGFGHNIEVFLLTDDEYVFWHANPAAIAQSSWETFRGSENTLNYTLPGSGTYHFVVSNHMSPSQQSMAVKAQVKCVR
jgi:hypothetical protein